MRAMFASMTSRSTSSAGVSSAAFGPRASACAIGHVSDLLQSLRRAVQAGRPIGVLDEAKRLEIVGGSVSNGAPLSRQSTKWAITPSKLA